MTCSTSYHAQQVIYSLQHSPFCLPHGMPHRTRLPRPQLGQKILKTHCRATELASAGRSEPAPDYQSIDSQLHNRLITQLFRRKMVAHLKTDSKLDGYDAIIDLTRTLNSRDKSPRETQRATQSILKSLFPPKLLPAFRAIFSRPFPEMSCRLNAWVTALTCQWLMGPCKINDVKLPDGSTALSQGVLVERCRYLEQSGCASICLNSCKVPTQTFFAEEMQLPLRMTPNYEDFSCQFDFGIPPLPQHEDDAFQTPCFSQCPTNRANRRAEQCPGIDSL